MITIKEAVEKALVHIQDLYGSGLNALKLEETELTEDEQYWLVTLGFDEELPPTPVELLSFSSPSDIPHISYNRVYKIFKINAANGSVLSMKIRKP